MESYISNQNVAVYNSALVAANAVAAGTVLLSQPPLASVPLPAIRRKRCNYCLRKVQLQCCSRCRSAYFCSNECFRNAWLHFHRVLCEPQESDIYKDVDADRWLLERTALTLHSHDKLSKHHSHSPPHLPAAIQALYSLGLPECSTNSPNLADVANALEPFGCHVQPEELALLWRRIQVATFDILDHEHQLDPVGVGIYPLTALFVRHSCRPNAAVVYKRGEQVLVAIEDIQPGEPITICYVDLVATKEQRQAALAERFGPNVVCNCSRCEGDFSCIDELLNRGIQTGLSQEEAYKRLEIECQKWNVLEMVKLYSSRQEPRSPTETLDTSNFTHYVSRIMSPDMYYPIMDPKRRPNKYQLRAKEDRHVYKEKTLPAIHALLEIKSVPPFTIASIVAADRLLKHLISTNRWVEASRCALYMFVIYRIIYPQCHPVLSYHSLILVRSCWNSLVQLELAGIGRKLERIYENGVYTWLEVAKDAVLTTFGKDCTLWREVIDLQWVIERDQKLK
ncbi:hypothetical protein VTP01DRAFT_6610 [Rhizomucor pusillus]|uniref:uncharacterized protein n=1 Tax=Rhizomucor pusillus TaxID=4840 RepID=UPI0037435D1A